MEPWWVRHRPKSSVPPSWREVVLTKPYYAPSCFTYTFLGLLVWSYRVELAPALYSFVPWPIIAATLLLQGPASYLADVHSLARSSWWHLFDAVMASLLTAFYLQSTIFGLPHGTYKGTMQLVGALLAAVAAVACFGRSRTARKGPTRCPESYAFWHTMWHITLPVGSAFVVLTAVHVPGAVPHEAHATWAVQTLRETAVYTAGTALLALAGATWALHNIVARNKVEATSTNGKDHSQ